MKQTFNSKLSRQRQPDLYELEANLVHGLSSRPAGATLGDPVTAQTNKQTNENLIVKPMARQTAKNKLLLLSAKPKTGHPYYPFQGSGNIKEERTEQIQDLHY